MKGFLLWLIVWLMAAGSLSRFIIIIIILVDIMLLMAAVPNHNFLFFIFIIYIFWETNTYTQGRKKEILKQRHIIIPFKIYSNLYVLENMRN